MHGPFKLDGVQGSLSVGLASELFYSLKYSSGLE